MKRGAIPCGSTQGLLKTIFKAAKVDRFVASLASIGTVRQKTPAQFANGAQRPLISTSKKNAPNVATTQLHRPMGWPLVHRVPRGGLEMKTAHVVRTVPFDASLWFHVFY
jgi:hypothetical protein